MINLNYNNEDSFNVEIQGSLPSTYSVVNSEMNVDLSNNTGEIIIFIQKDSNIPQIINYAYVQLFNGLSIDASFNVRLLESNGNDKDNEEVHVHQELGINVERPVENNSISNS